MSQIADKYIDHFKNLDFNIKFNANNNKVAVIVETRPHKYLLGIIKNVMYFLGSEWNLHIFHSKHNETMIRNGLQGQYRMTDLAINDLNQASYSLLLQSPLFWNQIDEENILIFQTDSFICRSDYKIPMQYGFIGAKYTFGHFDSNSKWIDVTSPPQREFSINGGFSFRKKSIMIDCIKNISVRDIINHRAHHGCNIEEYTNKFILMEDCYFMSAMDILNYNLPSADICDNFCSQNTKTYSSFGVHGFDKSYCNFSDQDLAIFCQLPAPTIKTESVVNVYT